MYATKTEQQFLIVFVSIPTRKKNYDLIHIVAFFHYTHRDNMVVNVQHALLSNPFKKRLGIGWQMRLQKISINKQLNLLWYPHCELTITFFVCQRDPVRIRACARRNPPKRYGKTHMPSSSSSLLASVLLAASTSFVVSEARFFLFTTDCHVIVNTCINILQISITNRLTTTHRWMHRNFQSNILFMRGRGITKRRRCSPLLQNATEKARWEEEGPWA